MGIVIYARRKYVYHLKHTWLLTFLVSLMLFPAYAIEVTDIANRLSHLVTLLLAQAVFIEYLGGSLPKLSYLTVLDEYILWNFVLTLGVAISMSIVRHNIDISDDESIDKGSKVDIQCFCAFV